MRMSLATVDANYRSAVQRSTAFLETRMSDVGWLVWFNLLFFEMWVQNTFGFSYIDELAVLFLFFATVFKAVRMRKRAITIGSLEKRSLDLLFGVCIIGLAGNVISGVSVSPSNVAVDLFTCIKTPIAFICAYFVFYDNQRIESMVEVESKFLIVIMLVSAVMNLLFDFGMGWEGRYGLRSSFCFVLGHPTMVVAACAGLVVILARNRQDNFAWMSMAFVIIALTLRSKGFVFIATAAILLITYGRHEKFTFLHLLLIAVCGIYLGYDQFIYYFSTEGTARNELTKAAVRIANDFFPLGGGFATFGSAVTANVASYSPLYYQYGISNIWGLTPGQTMFLSDTFWPTVIGQFGWIGFAFYVGMIGSLFAFFYSRSSGAKLSVLLCFAYLFISSTSESAFFHPMSVFIAFSLGIAIAATRSAQVQNCEYEDK